jgi:Vitamin K-dependent gamma-carboxylase
MLERAVSGWERFWFKPQSTSTVAVWRIAFGLVATAWTAALGPNLFTFFSDSGIQDKQPYGAWGLLAYWHSNAFLVGLYVVLLIACVCLTLGLFSRFASLLVFVGMTSLARRMPWIFNSGDIVLRVISFYIVLAPTGAALSLDRWRKHRAEFWKSPLRAPWALRLMQVQLSVIYISAVWAKMQGHLWNNGTAVYYAFGLTDLQRFPLPHFLTHNVFLINLQTYGTLAVEASIGVLVWNRTARPFVLAAGVFLHGLIDYAILVGFFSFAIWVCYTAFISPNWLDVRLMKLQRRLGRSQRLTLRRLALADVAVATPNGRTGLLSPGPRGSPQRRT